MTMAVIRPPPLVQAPPPKRDYLSYSAVTLYQQCPLRFYFKYLANLPEEIVSASLVFGSAMHSAVQHHYEGLMVSHEPPSLDTLLEVFWDNWHQHDGQKIQFGKTDDVNSLAKIADRMLRTFQASQLATPAGTIIGVEEQLRGPLSPGLPDLLARVDLLVETDEVVILRDFKTARSSWSQEQVRDSSGQLWLYSELVKNLADGKSLRLEFAVLTKAKFPSLTIHPVPLDPKQVERTKHVVERVWHAVQGGHFYPAPSPLSCPSCPYREPCRAWAG